MTHPFTTDEADYRRLMDVYGPRFERCKGGRMKARAHTFVHCGSDLPDECRSPITVAPARLPPPGRRVLIDGRECTLVELEEKS